MKDLDFSNQGATIEKLQELGVLDRLEAMFRILRVAADRNEFIPYTRNTTKGSFHYDLVRSVMSRVTLTGEFLPFIPRALGHRGARGGGQLSPSGRQRVDR